jgi:hypothetical protein
MDIIYCSKCGKMIPPGGPDEGKRYLVAGEPVCPKCYKQTPEGEHSGKTLLLSEGVAAKPASLEEDDETSFLPRPRISKLDMRPVEPEEAPERPGAARLLRSAVVVLVPVLAVGVLAAWWLLRQGSPNPAGTGLPAVPVTQRPPAVAPPPRGEPPPTRVEDEEKLRAALAAAEDYRRRHPQDFSGAIARFEKLKQTGRGTRWAAGADAAIAELSAERDRAVEEQMAALKARADALAEVGDFDGASAVFAKPAGVLAEQLRPRFESERRRLAARAEERLATILAAVEKCSQDGRPEQGLRQLDEAAAVKCADWTARLKKLRARLEAEKANAAATAGKNLPAEAARKLAEVLDGFEQRVLAGDCAGAADFLAAQKQEVGSEQLKLIAGDLTAAEQVAGLLRAEEARRRTELAKLPGRSVELTLVSGKKVSGKILSATDTELSVEVKQLAGPAEIVRIDKLGFRDLPRWEQERLVAPAKPAGPDGQLAAAAMAMVVGDVAGAEQALAAAGAHQLAPRWARRLDVLRLGAGEAAAKRAWEDSVAGLIRGKYGEADGQALSAALAAFLSAHGSSAFAKGRAGEIEELRLVGRVRELFRGRVKQFDPKTLEVELLWDFADPGQLGDFDAAGGIWKIEGQVLRGETKAKDDQQTLWTKASFAPGCRASCSGTVVDDRCLGLALGSPGSYVVLGISLMDLAGRAAKTAGLEGRGGVWGVQGKSLAARPEPGLALKKWYPLELAVDRAASSGKVGDGPALNGPGADYTALRAGLRVYPSQVGGNKPRVTVANFRAFQVAGKLDRTWLEAALRKAGQPPAGK